MAPLWRLEKSPGFVQLFRLPHPKRAPGAAAPACWPPAGAAPSGATVHPGGAAVPDTGASKGATVLQQSLDVRELTSECVSQPVSPSVSECVSE